MKRLKNEKGLTLVELLAVVVILAIVAAIAFVMIGNVMENAKKDAAVADALQVISAAKLYDTTVESIDEDGITVRELQGEGEANDNDAYLDTLHDPWTKNKYTPGESSTDGVTKTDEGYNVVLTFSKCPIDASEDKLIEEGREVCNKD